MRVYVIYNYALNLNYIPIQKGSFLMKKLLVTLITAILVLTMAIGCGEDAATPVSGVNGNVKSDNGSFAVEMDDYVYFINGKSSNTEDNTFGKPEKASLMRVKTSDLANPENATAEMVIPKLILTDSYKTGVYFYDHYVYYATPSLKKDKKGNIKVDQTEFYKFNLKTGKNEGSEIAISVDDSVEYRFIQVDGKVYLLFVETETHDEHSHSTLKVYNATDKKEVYTSPEFAEMLMPEDNSANVYFTKLSEGIKEDSEAAFHDLYRYTVGSDSATLVRSGTGTVDLEYNDRKNTVSDKRFDESGFQGVTINLIKNTGKYLITKISTLDSSNKATVYYGFELETDADLKNEVRLGASETNSTDKAFTATSYYKSLEEVYYIESSATGPKGLILFEYEKINDADKTKGRTIISSKCSDLAIQFVQGNYMYLAKTAEGIYYRLDLSDAKAEPKQINGVSMATSTSWFSPVVVGNRYFIGSYTKDFYKNYVYVIDMDGIDAEPAEGEDDNEFTKKYITPFADAENIERESIENLLKTRIGKITDADKTAIEELLEDTYSED